MHMGPEYFLDPPLHLAIKVWQNWKLKLCDKLSISVLIGQFAFPGAGMTDSLKLKSKVEGKSRRVKVEDSGW